MSRAMMEDAFWTALTVRNSACCQLRSRSTTASDMVIRNGHS